MIFLDSWVWLEFVFSGDNENEAKLLIERANTAGEGGLIAPTVIAEVSYRVRIVEDRETAKETVRAIRDFQHIESMPLIDDIAAYAADLRFKYYEPGERELSYADAIHAATAVVHDDCEVLYSGDPDFAAVDEIETIVL
ncbi:type II toxin-antitoxin system VapC family toxin [Halanaeroarchaeum sulfurireducens]|uniref:Ribonuclease VapC n=1 Tax=Halanaeroarchaeum sulfurireducens TaxID=1604004 RepID=A0A0F7PGD6_9EURY|nr:PIN domain-containing protein [Halanaeroarchaeum sulfurireducens]AKH98363.1 putative nucleic acid-binding protein, contains PIN domain protein [Halanaeroarchaeum sulfurireducens]ALG82757.1 putative nucleic acid-binding protein, contains PIN domain protein [Halanaeroarchaeum sulfurireducens]